MVKDNDIAPSTVNGYSMLIGGGIALLHSYFTESWNPLPVATENLPKLFLGISAMTLISNIVCYQLYGMMLKRFTNTLLSFFGLLSPIFASLNSWILIQEPPSLKIFLSTSIVCFGLWIFYRTELKQGYIKVKQTAA
jgi:drug/metabolite transporter (DMT)-like permease